MSLSCENLVTTKRNIDEIISSHHQVVIKLLNLLAIMGVWT